VAALRNVGNFFIGRRLRVGALPRTRVPLSRLPMGFLRPLKEAAKERTFPDFQYEWMEIIF
jgi:hypothetical protein